MPMLLSGLYTLYYFFSTTYMITFKLQTCKIHVHCNNMRSLLLLLVITRTGMCSDVKDKGSYTINRGAYMSANVLLNSLNELVK